MSDSTDLTAAPPPRDHGGDIDDACEKWGGVSTDWVDLSTGINSIPYPLTEFSPRDWAMLPDRNAQVSLETAARGFWSVPDHMDVFATPGASAAIARIPGLARGGRVNIPGPTYNEHAASFRAAGWHVTSDAAEATVVVNPNNPDGRIWAQDDLPKAGFLVIDESFCDVMPDCSLLSRVAGRDNTLVLKSFGKFWGLAGLRLGFVIGAPELIQALREMTGPWAVSGPALRIGTAALSNTDWAIKTRQRLSRDALRMDAIMAASGARCVGGTTLFRLYDVGDARAMQDHLARHQIWTRRFPYSECWLRLGLPGTEVDWKRLDGALA